MSATQLTIVLTVASVAAALMISYAFYRLGTRVRNPVYMKSGHRVVTAGGEIEVPGVSGVNNFAALPSGPQRSLYCTLVRGTVRAEPFDLVFFMNPDATPAETTTVGRSLKSDPNVRQVRFVSRDEARRQGIRVLRNEGQAAPPFDYYVPESFRVMLKPSSSTASLLPRMSDVAGVRSVDFPAGHRYPRSLKTLCGVSD